MICSEWMLFRSVVPCLWINCVDQAAYSFTGGARWAKMPPHFVRERWLDVKRSLPATAAGTQRHKSPLEACNKWQLPISALQPKGALNRADGQANRAHHNSNQLILGALSFMPTRQHLANAIRVLSMDAVQKANSGHPGAPMGMADIAEVLWNDFVQHNPLNPDWARPLHLVERPRLHADLLAVASERLCSLY